MTRLTRQSRCALVAACSCLLVAAATSIAAADDIPRPPGAIDNRGYELVSPPDKNRNPIPGSAQLSSDGNSLLYITAGPTPDDPSGVYSMLVSTRTGDGWTTKNILPPLDQQPDRQYLVSAARPDLSSVIASAFNGIGLGGSTRVTLAQLDGAGGQSLLHRFPRFFGLSGIDVVASDDLGSLSVLVPADVDPALPGAAPGVGNLYDFGGGTPELIGAMPGTGLAPACGIDPEVWNFARAGQSSQSERWTSADGSRVFFATRGDTCTDPLQLYVRDTVARTTTLISGPVVGIEPDQGVSRFWQGASDASWAIYTSPSSYDPADEADGNATDMDVYRWSAATGQSLCLTCVGESVDVLADTTVNPTRRLAVSEDGSHVYFTSLARVADAPSAGDPSWPNTYVWRQGHAGIKFVAPSNGVTSLPPSGGYVTPNGKTLLFTSNAPGLDLITGTSNGLTLQLYRYDSDSGGVSCLSCPPGRVATTFVDTTLALPLGSIFARARPATDDGSMVFFGTQEKLVPEDLNGTKDVYEWHDGEIKLITSGVTNHPSASTAGVVGTSPDGSDFFFFDIARHTGYEQDDTLKLFDARVDGGFPPPADPVEPCHGDCRGPASAPPALPGVGSTTRTDAGNAVPGDAGSFRVAKPRARQRARAAKSGRLVLAVRVSGGGRVEALAQARIGKRIRVVAHRRLVVDEAGRARVVLRLSKAARRQLARGKRVRVVVAVSFADALESKRLAIPLKRPGKGGASRAARRASVRATADGR